MRISKPYRNVQFIIYGESVERYQRIKSKFNHSDIYEAGLRVLDPVDREEEQHEVR